MAQTAASQLLWDQFYSVHVVSATVQIHEVTAWTFSLSLVNVSGAKVTRTSRLIKENILINLIFNIILFHVHIFF